MSTTDAGRKEVASVEDQVETLSPCVAGKFNPIRLVYELAYF